MLNLRACCAVVVLISAVPARAITINTDFFFLLDASGSVGGTDRAIQKTATETLIEDTIDPSNTGARVGFASFADDVIPGVSLGNAVATDTEDPARSPRYARPHLGVHEHPGRGAIRARGLR